VTNSFIIHLDQRMPLSRVKFF